MFPLHSKKHIALLWEILFLKGVIMGDEPLKVSHQPVHEIRPPVLKTSYLIAIKHSAEIKRNVE